jgi:GT2 family glycosyltransferase
MPDLRTSVVVITHDRREELDLALTRLTSLPERPHVVVVDNGSRDGTVDAVCARHRQVEVIALDRDRGASARNVALRALDAPYAALCDDDSWWAPGALAEAARLFEHADRLAVLNARILVGPEDRLDPVCELMARSPLGTEPGLPGPSLLGFVACGAVVRRRAFRAVGGFDDVVRFPGEEERVALDLASLGWVIAYVDSLTVHHHPSPQRHSPAEREAAVVRAKLLTALMRRPWPVVARTLAQAWRGGRSGRAGIGTALPDLAAAGRQRRLLPGPVEAKVQLLTEAEALLIT